MLRDLALRLLRTFVVGFAHGLPPHRILLRLVDTVLLCGGLYLAVLGPPALRTLGFGLIVVGGLLLVYDTLTVHRHFSDDHPLSRSRY